MFYGFDGIWFLTSYFYFFFSITGKATHAGQTGTGQCQPGGQGRDGAARGGHHEAVPAVAGSAKAQLDDRFRPDQHLLAAHLAILFAVAGQAVHDAGVAAGQGEPQLDVCVSHFATKLFHPIRV